MSETVSLLDAEGYFSGCVVADPDFLEPGKFLLPSGCIALSPPAKIEPGMRYRPVDGEWIGSPVPAPTPDPVLTPEEIAAAAAAGQRVAALAEIGVLEAQQARPVREIVAALLKGATPPPIAVERLAAIEATIAELRTRL